MDFSTAIGVATVVCSTASFPPKAWQVIRRRDTASISGQMYLLTVAAFPLWSCYGLLRGDWTLILLNAICLTVAAFILV